MSQQRSISRVVNVPPLGDGSLAIAIENTRWDNSPRYVACISSLRENNSGSLRLRHFMP